MTTPKDKSTKAPKAAKAKKPPPTAAELDSPRTPEQFWLALRRKMKLFYDIQEMRLQAQGRITRKSPTNPVELHPRDLEKLSARVKDTEVAERNALKDLAEQLGEVPFYAQVIEPERKGRFVGLGPRMASVIIASFDIHREDTVSKCWAFAGLAPIPARRCSQCHVVCNENGTDLHHPKPQGNKCPNAGGVVSEAMTYASGKSMKPVSGEKLKYNAWLRSKLCGVMGPVLLQCGSPYRVHYDSYKHRKQTAGWGISDGHRHNAAIRKMIKMLLLDIWTEWRRFENLPVTESYAERFISKHGDHGAREVGPTTIGRMVGLTPNAQTLPRPPRAPTAPTPHDDEDDNEFNRAAIAAAIEEERSLGT